MISKRYKFNGRNTIPLSDIQIKARDSIRKKIEDRIYLKEKSKCLCGNFKFKILAEKDRFGLPVSFVICKKCGLVQISQRFDEESNFKFYNSEYLILISGNVNKHLKEKKF